jgi:hypothetical protein
LRATVASADIGAIAFSFLSSALARRGFLGQPRLADLLGELLELVAALLALVAELALDRLQLLVQIIFALGLLHLALDAAADLLLDLEHAELALHEGEHHLQPARGIELAEQRLLVGDLDRQVRRDRVGERRRILDLASWMPVSGGSAC